MEDLILCRYFTDTSSIVDRIKQMFMYRAKEKKHLSQDEFNVTEISIGIFLFEEK